MLRVSMEAARLADPNALIATGGIGYSTFLSAILRYSDNPKDGSITKEYPKSGGEYFDVLSFHHYPIYTDGNSDAGVQGYIDHYTDLNDTLQIAGKEVIGFENTETGAPRYAIDDYPGSVQYARNYLMKVMITAWGAGVHGIDWFVLSDGALEGEGNSSYDYMGLYEDVVDLEKTADAVITPTGVGYETLGMLLDGARYDVEGTKDLQLDNNVKGAAFVIVDGKKAVALWIEDPNGKIEDISKSVDVSLEGSYNRYEWDYSSTNESEEVSSAAGVITLTLSSSVTILVEN
jgi:hypothetical protein